MYAKITTRCNMACAHCGMACTKEGEDMPPEVFSAYLDWAENYGDIVVLGGGEPTVHPLFLEFVAQALGKELDLFCVTNGKETEKALFLARLNDMPGCECLLSRDRWHEPIDDVVVDAFEPSHIRNVGEAMNPVHRVLEMADPIKAGRCDWEGANEGCICPDLTLCPGGEIKWCGCADAPVVGHILEGGYVPSSMEVEGRPVYIEDCWKENCNEDLS